MANVELFYIINEDKYKLLQKCKNDKELADNHKHADSGISNDNNHGNSEVHPPHMDPASPLHDKSDNEASDDMHDKSRDSDADDNEAEAEETFAPPMSTHDILKKFNGGLRPQARILLHLLKGNLKWNEKGEVITLAGEVIQGSNMHTILRNLLQPYKKRHVVGSHYVDNLLNRMDIPIKSLYKSHVAHGNSKKTTAAAAAGSADTKKSLKWLRF